MTPDNFVHEDDNLVLEDESGRVNLKGSVLSPSVYVTGIYQLSYNLILKFQIFKTVLNLDLFCLLSNRKCCCFAWKRNQ